MRKIISLSLVTILSLQLFSCGYVLRPERRGQKSGKVDIAIVGLDSIGILFFILPGLIAFAVDIYSGTIYMPEKSAQNSDPSKISWGKAKKIKIDDKLVKNQMIDKQAIADAIKKSTGMDVDLNDSGLRVYKI